MSRLRLDLIVRRYRRYGLDSKGIKFADDVGAVDRWLWRLWSGSRIVSTSGPQLYSRRIDCVRGAEVGAGLVAVVDGVREFPDGFYAWRHRKDDAEAVLVRIIDERGGMS